MPYFRPEARVVQPRGTFIGGVQWKEARRRWGGGDGTKHVPLAVHDAYKLFAVVWARCSLYKDMLVACELLHDTKHVLPK